MQKCFYINDINRHGFQSRYLGSIHRGYVVALKHCKLESVKVVIPENRKLC